MKIFSAQRLCNRRRNEGQYVLYIVGALVPVSNLVIHRVRQLESAARELSYEMRLYTVRALGGVQRATPVVITFFQYTSTGKIFLV